jgi:group I intron endonuclease
MTTVFFCFRWKGDILMAREKVSGIYMIKNLTNEKIYIGQSVDIQKRFWDHKRELKYKTHRNSYIQRSWDKYGENNFLFEIIEEYPRELLNERETYWIKFYKSNNSTHGYNTNDGGDSRSPNAETREAQGC